jgi:hypothetical protein
MGLPFTCALAPAAIPFAVTVDAISSPRVAVGLARTSAVITASCTFTVRTSRFSYVHNTPFRCMRAQLVALCATL